MRARPTDGTAQLNMKYEMTPTARCKKSWTSMNRTPSHRAFSLTFHPCARAPAWLKVTQNVSAKTFSSTCHHMSGRSLSLHPLTSSSFSCVSTSCPISSSPLSWSSSSMWSKPPSSKTTAHTQNEEYCPVAIHNPLTGYEPNQLDNFDYSETSAAIFQNESVDIDTSVLFSHVHVRGDPCTNQVQICLKNGNQVATWKTRFAEVRSEIQKHELQAQSDRRSIQELTGISDSQRMEFDHTITGCEQSRRDHLRLQEEISEQNRDLREACIKSLHEMEELKRVQKLRVDEFSRRRLIENQDTVNELTARIQELQNEANCTNDSRFNKDAESVRSGPSHVPS